MEERVTKYYHKYVVTHHGQSYERKARGLLEPSGGQPCSGCTEGFLDEVLYAPIAEMGKEGDSGRCLERIDKLCGQMWGRMKWILNMTSKFLTRINGHQRCCQTGPVGWASALQGKQCRAWCVHRAEGVTAGAGQGGQPGVGSLRL